MILSSLDFTLLRWCWEGGRGGREGGGEEGREGGREGGRREGGGEGGGKEGGGRGERVWFVVTVLLDILSGHKGSVDDVTVSKCTLSSISRRPCSW